MRDVILTEHELDEWVRGTVAYAREWGVADQLRAALVGATLVRSFHASAPDLPTRPAGADEPEADPPQTVAADPSVVDAESDPSYRHGVHGRSSLSDDTRRPPSSEAAGVPPLTEPDRGADALREHERQSWLRRVQAQPIR